MSIIYNRLNMTQKEYNADYWCIVESKTFKRQPVCYTKLRDMLGNKFDMIINKLVQNKNQKLILRPFHGWQYNFYRH